PPTNRTAELVLTRGRRKGVGVPLERRILSEGITTEVLETGRVQEDVFERVAMQRVRARFRGVSEQARAERIELRIVVLTRLLDLIHRIKSRVDYDDSENRILI